MREERRGGREIRGLGSGPRLGRDRGTRIGPAGGGWPARPAGGGLRETVDGGVARAAAGRRAGIEPAIGSQCGLPSAVRISMLRAALCETRSASTRAHASAPARAHRRHTPREAAARHPRQRGMYAVCRRRRRTRWRQPRCGRWQRMMDNGNALSPRCFQPALSLP